MRRSARPPHRVDVMEGLGVAEEGRRTEFRIEYLMRRGIEERPRHEEAEDENEAAVGRGLGHDPVPSLG